MTINVTPAWRYWEMEAEFNRRQMAGEQCSDLVRFMVRAIFPTQQITHLYWGGPRSYRI
jgi:hypothetical protein